MYSTHYKGKVILMAAGPGDPELLTIKALKYLKSAEVVFTDRLVSPVILNEYVAKGAEIIAVGKQSGKGASTPQATINELMVQAALQGKAVVRLKGGDVTIFSNIMDELEALVKHNIPYEIVPGVTAGIGAAAYSGIPLTARGYATAVRFLTYYKKETVTETYWKELAQTDDTLVFYMSVETLPLVVEKLTGNGIAHDKWLAVVEQATTPLQRIHTCSLYDYKTGLENKKFSSPSLIIIGKVVALHEQFKWLQNGAASEAYFSPVEGKLFTYPNKAAIA